MRLINVRDYSVREFPKDVPKYSILSHTWAEGEVTFQEMQQLDRARQKQGFKKIQFACKQSVMDGLEWTWVDTCCIDKTNNAELTEAITSMFRWYKDAEVCFVYLSDLAADAPEQSTRSTKPADSLSGCRWFTRGWTLQELIAPKWLKFFDTEWNVRGEIYRPQPQDGPRQEGEDALVFAISAITAIQPSVLRGNLAIADQPVCVRMSWAAKRETTKPEDRAYSLLGIFDINIPLFYGEGATKSFRRLQEEICRQSNDLSIFAWETTSITEPYCGIFARTPDEFSRLRKCEGKVILNSMVHEPEFSITNRGLCVRVAENSVIPAESDFPSFSPRDHIRLLDLRCSIASYAIGMDAVFVGLTQYGPDQFVRMAPWKLVEVDMWTRPDPPVVQSLAPVAIYIATDTTPAIARAIGSWNQRPFSLSERLTRSGICRPLRHPHWGADQREALESPSFVGGITLELGGDVFRPLHGHDRLGLLYGMRLERFKRVPWVMLAPENGDVYKRWCQVRKKCWDSGADCFWEVMEDELARAESRAVKVPGMDWRGQSNNLEVSVTVEVASKGYLIGGEIKLDVEPPNGSCVIL